MFWNTFSQVDFCKVGLSNESTNDDYDAWIFLFQTKGKGSLTLFPP